MTRISWTSVVLGPLTRSNNVARAACCLQLLVHLTVYLERISVETTKSQTNNSALFQRIIALIGVVICFIGYYGVVRYRPYPTIVLMLWVAASSVAQTQFAVIRLNDDQVANAVFLFFNAIPLGFITLVVLACFQHHLSEVEHTSRIRAHQPVAMPHPVPFLVAERPADDELYNYYADSEDDTGKDSAISDILQDSASLKVEDIPKAFHEETTAPCATLEDGGEGSQTPDVEALGVTDSGYGKDHSAVSRHESPRGTRRSSSFSFTPRQELESGNTPRIGLATTPDGDVFLSVAAGEPPPLDLT